MELLTEQILLRLSKTHIKKLTEMSKFWGMNIQQYIRFALFRMGEIQRDSEWKGTLANIQKVVKEGSDGTNQRGSKKPRSKKGGSQ